MNPQPMALPGEPCPSDGRDQRNEKLEAPGIPNLSLQPTRIVNQLAQRDELTGLTLPPQAPPWRRLAPERGRCCDYGPRLDRDPVFSKRQRREGLDTNSATADSAAREVEEQQEQSRVFGTEHHRPPHFWGGALVANRKTSARLNYNGKSREGRSNDLWTARSRSSRAAHSAAQSASRPAGARQPSPPPAVAAAR